MATDNLNACNDLNSLSHDELVVEFNRVYDMIMHRISLLPDSTSKQTLDFLNRITRWTRDEFDRLDSIELVVDRTKLDEMMNQLYFIARSYVGF